MPPPHQQASQSRTADVTPVHGEPRVAFVDPTASRRVLRAQALGARLKIAVLIVDHSWPVARAAERYGVSCPTAKRWADRYAPARAGRHAGRVVPPTPPADSHRTRRPQDGAPALEATHWSGRDRRQGRRRSVDGPCRTCSLPDQPVVPPRPGRRGCSGGPPATVLRGSVVGRRRGECPDAVE